MSRRSSELLDAIRIRHRIRRGAGKWREERGGDNSGGQGVHVGDGGDGGRGQPRTEDGAPARSQLSKRLSVDSLYALCIGM